MVERKSGMANLLKKRWWALLARGLATMLFGVIALAQPNVTTLVLAFVVFALVDGIAGVIVSIVVHKEDERWWLAVLRGLAGIAPGVLALAQPQRGALQLLYIIAARALLTGIMDILKAIRVRKEIEGQYLLAWGGLSSVLFGLIAFIRSGDGALAITALIANHALFFGMSLTVLAFRMRGSGKKLGAQ
jgi:uncharacterized membrane protein HdeD (DUF308 family)